MDKREEEWEGGREERSRLCPYLPQTSASLLEFLNEMKCKTKALKNWLQTSMTDLFGVMEIF